MTVLTGNGCSNTNSDFSSDKGTFQYDLDFLKKHQNIIVLTAPDNPKAQIIVVPGYQGRVMTSSSGGNTGTSYGWINYDLIEENTFKPHMNAFGGEDRFWLSPEGGQYSVYFEEGKAFSYDNWQTPAVIDTVNYDITEQTDFSASFRKKAVLKNFSGTQLDFQINRKIEVLSKESVMKLLSLANVSALNVVGYQSVNAITNLGDNWNKETGMIGIWILGMFQPTPQTTIIVPYTKERSNVLQLTSNYFGDIPADRLKITDRAILLKADGNHRSKIGLSPLSALPLAGSYDAGKGVLTIVQYDLDTEGQYMKSTWQIHEDPFGGDALNAYNDGPLEDGSMMGPFYELESSSPGKPLKTGESLQHIHRTFHFEGDPAELNNVAESLLGVSIENL